VGSGPRYISLFLFFFFNVLLGKIHMYYSEREKERERERERELGASMLSYLAFTCDLSFFFTSFSPQDKVSLCSSG
jgi:hypothetical protein